MPPLIKIILLGVWLCGVTFAAEPAPVRPWETSALNVESGVLWKIGGGTSIAYRLGPTQLSWRSKEFLGHAFADGSRIVVRHRLTLIGTLILNGPESHYLGCSGSPSIEWWDRTGTWSFFSGAGGGFGWIDSRGVKGGQGQDFTLNWFMRGGVEHAISRKAQLTAGIMFQHMSNGGQTEPNPGIDAVGFSFGYSRSF